MLDQNLPLLTSVIISFALVLFLIGLVVGIFLLFGGNKNRINLKGRNPRLAVLDTTAIDTKRRLILVRRDNTEHLLLIGGNTDIVIEEKINRAARNTNLSQKTSEFPQPEFPEIETSSAIRTELENNINQDNFPDFDFIPENPPHPIKELKEKDIHSVDTNTSSKNLNTAERQKLLSNKSDEELAHNTAMQKEKELARALELKERAIAAAKQAAQTKNETVNNTISTSYSFLHNPRREEPILKKQTSDVSNKIDVNTGINFINANNIQTDEKNITGGFAYAEQNHEFMQTISEEKITETTTSNNFDSGNKDKNATPEFNDKIANALLGSVSDPVIDAANTKKEKIAAQHKPIDFFATKKNNKEANYNITNNADQIKEKPADIVDLHLKTKKANTQSNKSNSVLPQPKSIFDNLEEEMASLLGRGPSR